MSVQQGSKEYQVGIFGCFGNPKLCILTFCLPCYTVGKNAEGVGEDCMIWGLLACIGLNASAVTRWRLRQDRDLKGSMLMDILLHTLLPCCAMMQDASEIGWGLPEQLENAGKKKTTPAVGAGEAQGVDNPEMARA